MKEKVLIVDSICKLIKDNDLTKNSAMSSINIEYGRIKDEKSSKGHHRPEGS